MDCLWLKLGKPVWGMQVFHMKYQGHALLGEPVVQKYSLTYFFFYERQVIGNTNANFQGAQTCYSSDNFALLACSLTIRN